MPIVNISLRLIISMSRALANLAATSPRTLYEERLLSKVNAFLN
jgi:hypothetical protein